MICGEIISSLIPPISGQLKNPTGLEISSSNAISVFWWKVFSYQIVDDRFIKEEIKYSLRDLYGWFKSRVRLKETSLTIITTMEK